ncbi:O-antigen ligase family protein [Aureimonas psammosilenae]|uniref:O-antigen ligase family protein n=1 Tax=Aureimonas psammosilenae TaxID=2495496 RepID=UPI00186A1481|nr:O-antigen ligase family protein [Aureimonas psammosilenae]
MPPRSGLDLLAPAPAHARTGSLGHARAVLFRPSRLDLGRRNGWSNFAFFVLAAAGGSGATVVAILLASWSLISMALRRFRVRIERSDLPVLLSLIGFFAVMAGSDLIHAGGDGGAGLGHAWHLVGKLLLFLLPVFLIPRMRCSVFRDTLPPAFAGAAVGGVLLIPICILSYAIEGERVAGLAGNPGPLSICALLAAGFSVLSLPDHPTRSRAVLAVVGCLGASFAVMMSGMRGAWPALPVVIAIALFARRGAVVERWRAKSPLVQAAMSVAVLLGVALVAVAVARVVGTRVEAMVSDLSQIAADVDSATSLNLRRAMYEAGMQAFAAQPFFGYGEAARWSAIQPYLDSQAFAGFSFSHLHNIFLTVGVDAGLLGIAALCFVLAAPVWTAWRARGRIGGGRRLAASLVLVTAFLVPGFSNIMFFHDILDSVWVFAATLIAASVPPRQGQAA